MWTIESHAKLNLFLNLIGRKENGYHNIESIMTFLEFYDEITIEESENLEVNFTFNAKIKFPPIDKNNNSIVKIINNFEQIINQKIKLKINIKKNIPVGSGLGGGSSNSAAILKFLQNHYQYKLSKDQEIKIALSIGCDTVACLYENSIFVEGVGEIVKECNLDEKLKKSHILLVYPQIPSLSIESYKVFKSHNMPFSEKISNLPDSVSFDFIKKQNNDLTDATKILLSEINYLAEEFERYNLQEDLIARMSGSGSTFFVISNDLNKIIKIDQELKNKFPNYFYKITSMKFE